MGEIIKRFFFVKLITILFLFLIVVTYSCSSPQDEGIKNYYTQPEQKNDGLSISTPEKEGMNQDLIEDLLGKIENNHYKNIHNFLIIKNGKLILDVFYKRGLTIVDSYVDNRDIELHAVMSVTKSLVSILVGIAIEKHIISGTGERVYPYFPEYKKFENWNKIKPEITIKNFLTMRHGLLWDETSYKYSDPENTYYQMEQYSDWVKFTLDREIISRPGEKFAYSTGASHTMEALISNASGISFPEFAREYLFKELGIKKSKWFKAPNGRADDVYLTGRSMAKLGQLILNKGSWNGKQIVSPEWIRESTENIVKVSENYGYGYFWWRHTFNTDGNSFKTILAWGYGGQFIFIFPDQHMVVCFTSGNYTNDLSTQPFEMIRRYILPSIF